MIMVLTNTFLHLEYIKHKFFRTDISKKEFWNFVDKILPAISECGLCEKYSCKWHKIYSVTCNQCRDMMLKLCNV